MVETLESIHWTTIKEAIYCGFPFYFFSFLNYIESLIYERENIKLNQILKSNNKRLRDHKFFEDYEDTKGVFRDERSNYSNS